MAGCCEHDACGSDAGSKVDSVWMRVLWIALLINGVMFLAELAAGFAASSSALQADSLDFLGDSANYAISLGVVGMSLAVRSRAALLKGASLALLGLWVVGSASWRAWAGDATPRADVMGLFGFVALLANAGVALMLFRFRRGDANMRSVWICSRNDAIGNIAVVLAALGVFGTGSLWPDVIVAVVMAALSITGGWTIVRHAMSEIRATRQSAEVAAE